MESRTCFVGMLCPLFQKQIMIVVQRHMVFRVRFVSVRQSSGRRKTKSFKTMEAFHAGWG